jgi:hypothetical protein
MTIGENRGRLGAVVKAHLQARDNLEADDIGVG